jgi:hypothetical protein
MLLVSYKKPFIIHDLPSLSHGAEKIRILHGAFFRSIYANPTQHVTELSYIMELLTLD